MKKQSTKTLVLSVLNVVFIFLTAFTPNSEPFTGDYPNVIHADVELKKEALKVLEEKCNVCHRKQNPFMVFNQKNMVKRAPKIYKQVFIKKRMPKGNEIRLTNEEYDTLKKWLFTTKTF